MIEAIETFLAGINHELAVFIVAMLPIIELRGAIPFGVALGVEWYVAYLLAVAGNILPVPFIIYLFRPIIDYLEKTKLFGKLASKIKKRTNKKIDEMNNSVSDKGIDVEEYEKKKYRKKLIGLYIFVALPLPGTGAWTGAAIAALMKMRIKHSFWTIAAGVVSAGIIMLTGSKIVEWIVGIV